MIKTSDNTLKNKPSAIKYRKGPKPKFIEIVLFEKAPNKSEIKYKLAERITKLPILSNNWNDSDSKIIFFLKLFKSDLKL